VKKFLLGLLALIVLGGTIFIVPTWWGQPWSIDHFYTRVLLKYMLGHPQLITQIGLPLPIGRDRLDDYSPAAEDADLAMARENLARLHRYDRSKLQGEARLSYDTMEWFLESAVAGEKFKLDGYPLNQLFGFQSELPDFMISTQPLRTPRDAESYVRRVGAFGTAIDQTLARLRMRDSAGVIPPRFVLREVRDQMVKFSSPPPDSNLLYTHFVAATDTLKGLDPHRRDALRSELAKEVAGTVVPSYRKLIAFVSDQEARATDDDGVWKLPNGDAFYDFALRTFTTSDLPADTIHALGLEEVARLEAQMTALMNQKKLPSGAFGDRMRRMRKDPHFGYPAGDSGRAMILADYGKILDDASQRSNALFDVRPKGRLEVKRVPAFKEATSPGAYYNPPAVDGSRPGVFFANLRDPEETKRPDMRTLAYHEGIPGHHFQLTIAQELKGLPFFRKILPFTAYSEGWALYAERLALENGFHRDAFDSLGAMDAELFRAVRLVVDTGIHRDHWTRRQAIDYMVANTGMDTSAVVTEIERYIVMPGQACAYKVGQLEILRLRQRAMERLGPRFDIRKFHDEVLTHGALPLTLLERVIDDWIAREESSPATRKG
jgi:uncharacterized protein (DUF885 family)